MNASTKKQTFSAVTANYDPTKLYADNVTYLNSPDELVASNTIAHKIFVHEPVLCFVDVDSVLIGEQHTQNGVFVNGKKVYSRYVSDFASYSQQKPYFYVNDQDIITYEIPENFNIGLYFAKDVVVESHPNLQEEIGEGDMEAPQELHPTDTKTKLKINSEDSIPTPSTVDIQHKTDDSAEAIDVEVTAGTTSSRVLSMVPSPNGMVSAIHLSDKDPISLKPAKHLMSAALPEWSVVWKKLRPTNETTHFIYNLDFNDRVKLQMLNFKHYSTLTLYKLVAPLPLFSSQRFWVALDTGITAVHEQDKVGFEWCPSEEPEIYVVAPWTSNKLALPVETPPPGGLSLSDITPHIYSTGLPSTVEINVFCSPLDMKLYTPCINDLPIPPEDLPLETVALELVGNNNFFVSGTSEVFATVGDISGATSFPIEVSLGGNTCYVQQSSGQVTTNPVLVLDEEIIDINITNTPTSVILNLFGSSPFTVTPDDPVKMVSKASKPFNPFSVYQMARMSQAVSDARGLSIDEVDEQIGIAFEDNYSSDEETLVDSDDICSVDSIDPYYSEARWTVSAEEMNRHRIKVTGSVKLMIEYLTATKPTMLASITAIGEGHEFDLFSMMDGECSATPFIPKGVYEIRSFNTESWNLEVFPCFRDSYVEFVPLYDEVEEQIGGLHYDEHNKVAEQAYGKLGDHTQRLDTHWALVDSYPIVSTDDQILIDFSNTQSPYVWQDLLRHLFSAKFPILQMRATSVPSANLNLRLTQLPPGQEVLVSLDQALQLPGLEFNIKSGDIKVQPYWNSIYPVIDSDDYKSPLFQVDVLGGSLGEEPVYMSFFINPASLEYYHMATSQLQNVKRIPAKRKVRNPILSQSPNLVEEISDPQIQSQAGHMTLNNAHVGSTVTEQRWQFLDSFQISPTTGIVSIKLDSSILGPYFYRHAKRYTLWRGRPRLKVMFTNARIVNGNVHVVQSSQTPSNGDLPATYMEESGYSVSGAADSAILVDLKWRNKEILFNTVPDELTLGNLLILIPELSAGTSSTIPQNLVCTLHVDTSDIELDLPCAHAQAYQPLTITSYTRPAARIV